MTCFERALAAHRRVPESRANLEQTVDLLFDLRHSLLPLAAFPRMVAYVEEAARMRPLAPDPQLHGRDRL